MSTISGSAASAVVDIGTHRGALAGLQARHINDATSPALVGGLARRRSGFVRDTFSVEVAAEEVLSHQRFLRELQREKRRAERSGSALSLVMYRVDKPNADSFGLIERQLGVLLALKRETDTVGHLDQCAIAVLCPDTDESGAKAFIAKIAARDGASGFTAISSTYPDDAFDSLEDRQGHAPAALTPIVASDQTASSGVPAWLRRSVDAALASVALCLFSPLMAGVAVAIRLTSRGPIIFKQKRLGRGGVPFTFYKFRSMVPNGDDQIHRAFVANLIANNSGGQAPNTGSIQPASYKIESDPRVTPIGRFIRKTSIDELPQLFNVLKGDMSMVGPRPPIPYEAVQYQPWHLRRIVSVKPGITGLWQVDGRSKVTFDEMVRMDLHYIRNHSLALDLKILLKTVLVVLRCDGAR